MDCHCRSYGPIRVFFRSSSSWLSEGLFGQSFSIAPSIQAFRGLPCLGSFCCLAHQVHRWGPWAWVLLCRTAHQSLKGAHWVGSYSVVQGVSCLTGQPLYCSAADAGVCGEWEAMVVAVSPMHDSAVSPCFHGCLISSTGISHRALLPHILSICISALNSSVCPGIAPQSLDQLPAVAPSRRLAFLSSVCVAAARTVWFSFHLGFHRSAVPLSAFSVSPLTQTIAPMWDQTPASASPTLPGQVQSY